MLVLLYHRVGSGKHANSLEMFDEHFAYIHQHYRTLLPGDPLDQQGLCLTFDDASYDFYHHIFPLLKKYQLRVLLGVSTSYILPSSKLPAKRRLKVPYTLAMQEGIFEKEAPFCTWEELGEMVSSGLVEVASHSHLHCNLTFSFVDLEREVIKSKELIERHLGQPCSSFIYPFGRVNPRVHRFVKEHYAYAFRIGNATIQKWHQAAPLTRICCDHLTHPQMPFLFTNQWKYRLKSFIKSIDIASTIINSK